MCIPTSDHVNTGPTEQQVLYHCHSDFGSPCANVVPRGHNFVLYLPNDFKIIKTVLQEKNSGTKSDYKLHWIDFISPGAKSKDINTSRYIYIHNSNLIVRSYLQNFSHQASR